MADYRPSDAKWDCHEDRFNADVTYYVHHDSGLKVRCHDCLSQLAEDGVICGMCAYKRRRRLGKVA